MYVTCSQHVAKVPEALRIYMCWGTCAVFKANCAFFQDLAAHDLKKRLSHEWDSSEPETSVPDTQLHTAQRPTVGSACQGTATSTGVSMQEVSSSHSHAVSYRSLSERNKCLLGDSIGIVPCL